MWFLVSEYYDLNEEFHEVLRKREEKAASLPLHEQRELDGVTFNPTPAKKSRLGIEVSEEGVHLMNVRYDRY